MKTVHGLHHPSLSFCSTLHFIPAQTASLRPEICANYDTMISKFRYYKANMDDAFCYLYLLTYSMEQSPS